MTIKITAILILVTLLISCEKKQTIEGLWVIKTVKVGDQDLTPNARWMRFNADSTQQSGNGWFQHSFGTWKFDRQTDALSVSDSNGLLDPYGPFNVRIDKNAMYWDRKEDGENVELVLERSEKLPETYGDKLLGLWKLESAQGDGQYFKLLDQTLQNECLFFRWDRRFVINTRQKRINGVYNVHGHRPEVELIPYGNEFTRDFWSIDYEEDHITLKLLNTDSTVIRKFVRIHEFPG